MPSVYYPVILPTDETYWSAPFGNQDFTYYFHRGDGLKYAVLERRPQPPIGVEIFPVSPTVFTSEDGIDWLHRDPSSTVGGYGDVGPIMDVRFNGSQSTMSCFYDPVRLVDDDGFHYSCNVADYNFATQTWGAPRAPLSFSNTTALNRGMFSTRPDGKSVLVVSFNDGIKFYILTGNAWSAPHEIVASGSFTNLYVGADNKSHILLNGDHYLIDINGAVLSSGTAVFPVGPLRLRGTSLVVPAISHDITNFVVASGAPINSPSWTDNVVGAVSIFQGNQRSACFVNERTPIEVAFDFSKISDPSYIVSGTITREGSSGNTLYYISNDATQIFRTVYNGGVWSAPEEVFTAEDGLLDNLVVTESLVGSRYYTSNI